MGILSKSKIKFAIDNTYNTESNKNPRKISHAGEDICCAAHREEMIKDFKVEFVVVMFLVHLTLELCTDQKYSKNTCTREYK